MTFHERELMGLLTSPNITPEMIKLIAAPIPNFHEVWKQYNESGFRHAVLSMWAGDDPERLAVVAEMLCEKPVNE